MKQSGYWKSDENIRKEIDAFNLSYGIPGDMPKESELKVKGCSSLAFTVHKKDSFKKYAIAHGYQTLRRPNGHFKDFKVLKRELLEWVEGTGVSGTMPTAQELKDAIPSRHDLLTAIGKHGGFAEVAEKTHLRMSQDNNPTGYYNETANVAREVYAFVDEMRLENAMPTANQLLEAQESQLLEAQESGLIRAMGPFQNTLVNCLPG